MNNNSNLYSPIRIIRMKELVHKTGMSRSLLYEKMREGSAIYDDKAPRKIHLHGNQANGPVGFLESEVDEWIMSIIDRQAAR